MWCTCASMRLFFQAEPFYYLEKSQCNCLRIPTPLKSESKDDIKERCDKVAYINYERSYMLKAHMAKVNTCYD